MAQLKRELSTTLFEKIGRKMVLTQAGERLIPYVDDILSSVDRLRNLEEDLTQCRGDLSVGFSETQLCYRMPPILQALDAQAPRARFFLRSMNCYDIRDALIAGTLDIGVFYMEWNINDQSCPCGYCMPVNLIANQILQKSPHIFVQTEFVETAGWPDFHAVKIRINSVDISVVGTRIQIGPKLTKSEFKCRFSEFCAFVNYLTTLLETKNVIALGHFNNARILGNEGETNVEEIDKAYPENGVELVQSRYNLQKARAYLLRNTGGEARRADGGAT